MVHFKAITVGFAVSVLGTLALCVGLQVLNIVMLQRDPDVRGKAQSGASDQELREFLKGKLEAQRKEDAFLTVAFSLAMALAGGAVTARMSRDHEILNGAILGLVSAVLGGLLILLARSLVPQYANSFSWAIGASLFGGFLFPFLAACGVAYLRRRRPRKRRQRWGRIFCL